jgi:hypothetical protein
MKFHEPFAVYTASDNLEALFVADMLISEGIPALSVEDQSAVGLSWVGPLSAVHKPEVFVERAHAEKASVFIQEYESRKRERQSLDTDTSDIAVTCEDCGKVSVFAKKYNGTTQDCPHCHAYVDVGEFDWDLDVADE